MSYSAMATAATSTSSFNIKKLDILPAKCVRVFVILTVKIYYFYKETDFIMENTSDYCKV